MVQPSKLATRRMRAIPRGGSTPDAADAAADADAAAADADAPSPSPAAVEDGVPPLAVDVAPSRTDDIVDMYKTMLKEKDLEISALKAARTPGGSSSKTMEALSKLPVRGIVTVASSVVMHLVLGTLYCWGNFGAYAPANLKYFNGKSAAENGNKPPDTANVMPAMIVFQAVGMKIGGIMINKFGIGWTAHFGSALMALGIYLSSFQTRLWPFILTYSCITGTGIGTAYNAPLAAGWKYFPKRKGLVNGIVLTGFGAGGLIFNKVGTGFINPKGFSSPYPAEVTEKFSGMLRHLALIYFLQTQLSAILVRGPKGGTSPASDAEKEKPAAEGKTFNEAAKSATFWKLWLMIVCTATPCLNVSNLYKSFSSEFKTLNDDKFQSNVGGLGAINNGLGRLFWSSMVDVFGFEKPYMCLTVLQAALMAALPFCVNSRSLFAGCVALIYFTLGGNFAMFPTVNAQTFGTANAPEIYSLLFTAFATSGIVGAKFTQAMLKSLGWTGVFQVLAGMTLLSLGLVQTL